MAPSCYQFAMCLLFHFNDYAGAFCSHCQTAFPASISFSFPFFLNLILIFIQILIVIAKSCPIAIPIFNLHVSRVTNPKLITRIKSTSYLPIIPYVYINRHINPTHVAHKFATITRRSATIPRAWHANPQRIRANP